MVVCKFYLSGNCRFGNRCHNEHPRNVGSTSGTNSFGPLQQTASNGTNAPSNRGHGANRDHPYKLDKATIILELSKERPQWILSAYGPGREAPAQLFGGLPREQSFEELRLRHYELTSIGRAGEAIQEAQGLVKNAEQQIESALKDVDGAIKYIVDGERQHPNRIDVINNKAGMLPQNPGSGQSTVFGKPPPIGFGQQPAPSSSFGQKPSSTFGQPSALGQSATFGRQATSFGQPSTAMGGSSVPAAGNASFGMIQHNVSSFGSLSNQGSTTKSSAPVHRNNNPFGQPSSLTQSGPFGGRSTNEQSNPFGKPSVLNPANPFGQAAPAGVTVPASNANPFGQSTVPGSQSTQPVGTRITGQAAETPIAKIRNWKGKPVSYIDDEPYYKNNNSNLQRIWFPHGPPKFAKTPELPEEAYNASTKDDYEFAKEHGAFKNGVMPEIPPPRAWCSWDF